MRIHPASNIHLLLLQARINSDEGKSFIKAMNAAANFAFVNRSLMTHAIRNVNKPYHSNTAVHLKPFLIGVFPSFLQKRQRARVRPICVSTQGPGGIIHVGVVRMGLIYDVCHNIAKVRMISTSQLTTILPSRPTELPAPNTQSCSSSQFEQHEVGDKGLRQLLVHRKGVRVLVLLQRAGGVTHRYSNSHTKATRAFGPGR